MLLPNLSALAPSAVVVATDMQAADGNSRKAPITWLQADELAALTERTLRVMEDDSATEAHHDDASRRQLLVSLCEQLATLRMVMGATPTPEALDAAYVELAEAMQVDPVETAYRSRTETDAQGVEKVVSEAVGAHVGRMGHLLKERCNFLSRPWNQAQTRQSILKGHMILISNYVGDAEDYEDPGLTLAEKVARCIWFCRRMKRRTTRTAAETMMGFPWSTEPSPWSTEPLTLRTFPPPDRLYQNMNNEHVLFTHNNREVQARVVEEDADHVLTVTWTDAHGVARQATPPRTAVRLAPTVTTTGLEHLLMSNRHVETESNVMKTYHYAQLIAAGAHINSPEGIDTVRRVHPYTFDGNYQGHLQSALAHACLAHEDGTASRLLLTAVAHRGNMSPPDPIDGLPRTWAPTWVAASDFQRVVKEADKADQISRAYYLFEPNTPNLFYWADATEAGLKQWREAQCDVLTTFRHERAKGLCGEYNFHARTNDLATIRAIVNVPHHPLANDQAKDLLNRLGVLGDPTKAEPLAEDKAHYVRLVRALYRMVTDPKDLAQLQGVVAAAAASVSAS